MSPYRYAELGRKAAQALHDGDWVAFRFYRDDMLRTVATRADGLKALKAFNMGYSHARRARAPRFTPDLDPHLRYSG